MVDCTFCVKDLLRNDKLYHQGAPLDALAFARSLAEEDARDLGMVLAEDREATTTTFLARTDDGELIPLYRLHHVPEELCPGGLARMARATLACVSG